MSRRSCDQDECHACGSKRPRVSFDLNVEDDDNQVKDVLRKRLETYRRLFLSCQLRYHELSKFLDSCDSLRTALDSGSTRLLVQRSCVAITEGNDAVGTTLDELQSLQDDVTTHYKVLLRNQLDILDYCVGDERYYQLAMNGDPRDYYTSIGLPRPSRLEERAMYARENPESRQTVGYVPFALQENKSCARMSDGVHDKNWMCCLVASVCDNVERCLDA